MRRIFVISDLHLGGRPDARDASGRLVRAGFQICHAYGELIGFIDWLAACAVDSPSEEFELVINGDIVDFLAEDDYGRAVPVAQIWTADEAQVVSKLEKIVERTRGGGKRGVFDALRDFHATADCWLTLLIGNHDVELSLPAVRRWLFEMLGRESGRLTFVYDGEAYTQGRVLIEHGNRYDGWNMIDHSALRQERSVRSRGLPVEEGEREERYFIPPPGTHLVIQFMNLIKARYRFVDLLKPETNAVVPILIALEPERWLDLDRILKAGAALSRAAWNIRRFLTDSLQSPTMPEDPGNMNLRRPAAQTPSAPPRDLDGAVTQAMEEMSLRNVLIGTLDEDELDLFLRCQPPEMAPRPRAADEVGAMSLLAHAASEHGAQEDVGPMGIWKKLKDAAGWLWRRVEPFVPTRQSASNYFNRAARKASHWRYRQLHSALRRLNRTDHSFDVTSEHEQYLQAARATAKKGDFDAVVYGHTHLPKKINVGEPSRPRWYLNSGTWCDVVRLPEALSKDFEQAAPELERFVEALKVNEYAPYVYRYLSFVELLVDTADKGAVREANLYSYCGRGHERFPPLSDVSGHHGGEPA